MENASTCSRCGARLTGQEVSGQCGNCMLKLALELPPGATVPVEPPVFGSPESLHIRYFGDYELIEEIARGGMGIVYKARQASLNRIVALKMILAGDFSSPAIVERFQVEAEASARLDHPNIVTIFEIGAHEGHRYFSMRLVEGGTLTQWVTAGKVSLRAGAEMLLKVARAVHHAHQRGILHRDIKPGNILVDRSGEPLVADFGLARLLERDSALTQSTAVMGTPAYMAPEQAAGSSHHVTTAADIYSLGAILFYIATGRPPFVGVTSLEVLEQVRQREPVSPRSINPHVNRDLAVICLKCLQKDPARRYVSAEALAEDLQRWLEHKPIRASAVTSAEKVWLWCRRKPAIAALTGAVLFLLLAMLATSHFLGQRVERERKNTGLERARVDEEKIHAAEKRLHAYTAEAAAAALSGAPGQRLRTLDLVKMAAEIRPSLALRNHAIAAMTRPDIRVSAQWPGDGEASVIAFDGALERYARAFPSGGVSIRGTHDDHEFASISTPPAFRIRSMSFSDDGGFLALLPNSFAARDPEGTLAQVWSVQTTPVKLAAMPLRRPGAVDFSPDSRYLACSVPPSSNLISILNIAGGDTMQLECSSVANFVIRYHPTGTLLAYAGVASKILRVVETSTGVPAQQYSHPNRVMDAQWNANGTLLAVCSGEKVYVWDANTHSNRSVLVGHTANVRQAAFHPVDPGMIATVAWDGTTRFWDAARGKLLLTAAKGGIPLRFSADGLRCSTYRDGTTNGIFDVHVSQEHRVANVPGSGHETPNAVAVHPNGRIAATGTASHLRLWDLGHAREIASCAGDFSGLSFTPDGASLFTAGGGKLLQWPVHTIAHSVRIGPPQPTGLTGRLERITLSGDGRIVAVAEALRGALIFASDKPSESSRVAGTSGSGYPALSHDGGWLAMGNMQRNRIHLWRTATGESVADLQPGGAAQVSFSPDGRWLVAGTGKDFSFWRTSDWTLVRKLPRDHFASQPGAIAFSSDGRLAALGHSRHGIRLILPEDGSEIATLDTPRGGERGILAFSPDGRRLVRFTGDGLEIWNLRSIREELVRMNLDWAHPSLPSDPSGESHNIKITLDPGAALEP